jgi:hypothetical protein
MSNGPAQRVVQSGRVNNDLSVVNRPHGVKRHRHVSRPLDVDHQEGVGTGSDVAHRSERRSPLLDEDLVAEANVRHFESGHKGAER